MCKIVLQLWKQRSFSGGETGSRTGAEFVCNCGSRRAASFFLVLRNSLELVVEEQNFFSVAGEWKFAPTDGATKQSREWELLHTHHLYSVPIKIYLICLATCVELSLLLPFLPPSFSPSSSLL